MEYGLCTFPTEYGMHPAELGALAEDRGFESLWVAEHSHIPSSRETPWPGGPELPQFYYDVMDPFVCLSLAAQATNRLKLGTGICLVIQRDPIQTAKQVASLDVLSGGRFLFGVGGGWNAEEMANHGTPFEGRWKLLRERVEAMKAIWTSPEAEYHGEHVDFGPLVANPKPKQKPHPPIHVGGAFPGGLRRALSYGDGWIPLMGRGDDDIVKHIDAFRDEVHKAGRDPSEIEISIYGAATDSSVLKRYRDAGVSRAIFGVLSAPGQDMAKSVDELAQLKDKIG